MRRIMLAIAVGLGAINVSWSQGSDFKISEIFPIEREHSYVGFSIKYMGYAMVRGRFSDFRGAIRFDEKDITKTSVTLSIEVNSINTDNQWRDEDLRSDNWFGGKAYPRIVFVSKKALLTPRGLIITGNLTMKGFTKTISIPMTYPPRVLKDVRDDSQVIFTGAITLNRLEYGIEGKKWAGIKEGITAVSDEVNVELSILGKRINAPNFKYWVADVSSPHGKIYSIAKNIGTEQAIAEFELLRSTIGNKVDVETLNTAGMMLLKENRGADAVVLFKNNIEAYPETSIVYESCGEAVASVGNWREALKYYTLALEKDPENSNVQEIIRHIKDL